MPGQPTHSSTTGQPSVPVSAQALSFFESKGLTRNQAAGIIGNLKQESGLNASESGGFLAQWLGTRLQGLDSFAAGKHQTVAGNATVQLEYIWQELTTDEAGTLAALKKTKTPEEAAKVFSELFERPGEPDLANREKYAAEAAKGTGGNPLSAITAPIEGAVNGVKEALEPKTWARLGIELVLLLAGAALMVWGIMVAVGQGKPSMPAIPVPV
jgi:Phage tail lysozyme